MNKIFLLFSIPVFLLCSCLNKDKTPLIAKDASNKYEMANKLFVFVGEKISHTLEEDGTMDVHVKAKYKIIQRVYGDYGKDSIEFDVWDHYGLPSFLRYQHVLLFVSEDSGRYYHEKYQFYPVYKTRSNRWAGPDFEVVYSGKVPPGAEIIDYVDAPSFPLQVTHENGETDDILYPGPYYKTAGDSATAVYGSYVEELFKIKKEGVLSARGLFAKEIDPDDVIPTPMSNMGITKNLGSTDSIQLQNSFLSIIESLQTKNYKAFVEMSMDSIFCIISTYKEGNWTENIVYKSPISFLDSNGTSIASDRIFTEPRKLTKFFRTSLMSYQQENSKAKVFYSVAMLTKNTTPHLQSHALLFNKTKDGFRFAGLELGNVE